MKEDFMDILYTCDNNFCWIMGISMISLFENNKDCHELNVYLLGDGISKDNCTILTEIALEYNRKFILIDVSDLNVPKSLCSNRWPKSAFTRMFSGELMPKDVKKILYLDCDIIVKDSIKELLAFDTKEFAVCAVKDCVSKYYKNKIGIDNKDSYINAGVLLLDLEKMRELSISKMMDDFVSRYSSSINYADQDILNGIFSGKFGILPPQYDVMTLTCVYTYEQILQIRRPSHYYSKEEFEYSRKNPVIIHYTTCMLNIRPWCESSRHPYAEEFEKYKAKSPWANRPKNEINFDSSEHKVLKLILCLPDYVSYSLIGLIHAVIRPIVIKLKSKI